MSIVAIDPGSLRTQSAEKRRKASGEDFSVAMSSLEPGATAVVGLNKGYQPAAVTSAALSGVAGSSHGLAVANAPYYAPVSAGNYSYGGVPYGGYPAGTVPPGGAVGQNGFPVSYPAAGAAGLPGAPSQDYLEKQALFSQMNDANWEMLIAQVTVNNISRDFQFQSNILKTKSDTELNAVRNMRA